MSIRPPRPSIDDPLEGFGASPWDADAALPDVARKGRGAVGNVPNRFESHERVRVDDGWGDADRTLKQIARVDEPEAADVADNDEPSLATTVIKDSSRTIIARNTSPDVPFDRSINPYRGCEHGCIYCFARPTHAYLGLSPGLDFETRILYKPEAPALLRKELASPKYKCAVMAIGTNTDAYQPLERKLGVMRGILETLSEFNHPVGIVTKNHLVTRDIDILSDMAKRGLAEVFVSVTTLDRELARTMEPRASTPGKRLEAIRALNAAGVPTGVMSSPMIPALNDHEMEAILEAAHAAGARRAGYIILRLPLEIKALFEDWLRAHYPARADRVLSLVRQTRGGALYNSEFGGRMRGEGPVAELLSQRFATATRRLGLNRERYLLDTTKFKVPLGAANDAGGRQMRLF